MNNGNGNDQDIVARKSTWDEQGMFAFPRQSLTILRWRT